MLGLTNGKIEQSQTSHVGWGEDWLLGKGILSNALKNCQWGAVVEMLTLGDST